MRTQIFFFLYFFALSASAQVSDSFDDGDFEGYPSWVSSNTTGKGSDFIINLDNELQSDGTSSSSELFISTENDIDYSLYEVTWGFYFRYDASGDGSNSNKVIIHLISNKEILTDESGMDEKPSFCKANSLKCF